MYSVFAAQLARRTGCDIFAPDLRLAPEFPFPANLEDATAASFGLRDEGIDPRTLFIAGDSSGGGLVTSLVHTGVRAGYPHIGGALLFSPEVNLQLDCPSVRENAGRDILPWNIPTAAYLNGIDPASPLVSAIADDLTGWPPTFVSVGTDEMFRDAIRRFAEHLGEAGVDAEVEEEAGMFHVYPILVPWSDAARRTMAAAGAFVRSRLEQRAAGDGEASDPAVA
jgi:acetyl esterase/lipase